MFYHLGELDSALTYALGAGSLFNVNDTSDYVQTLVGEHDLLQRPTLLSATVCGGIHLPVSCRCLS